MVVNALHLKVDLLADVVVSSSHAGMSCVGAPATFVIKNEAGVELIWTATVAGLAGDNLTLAYIDPGVPNSPLSIAVVGGINIQVMLGDDAYGTANSTGDQIAALANSTPAVTAIATVTDVQGGFLETSFSAQNFSGGRS